MRSFVTLVALMGLFASKDATALPQRPPPNIANGNISPSSVNGPVPSAGSLPYPTYRGFPIYFRSTSGNTATSQIGAVDNQIGVASSNINPSSTNYPRDLEIPQDYPGGNTDTSTIDTTTTTTVTASNNLIGVTSGGANGNVISIHSPSINPTATNHVRDVDVPPPVIAGGNTGTVGNQFGAAYGNISPSSFNPDQFFSPRLPRLPRLLRLPNLSRRQ